LFFIFLPYIALFHNLFWVMFVFDDGLQAWMDPLGVYGAHDRLRAQPLQAKIAIFSTM
jgi:hypothetical protein